MYFSLLHDNTTSEQTLDYNGTRPKPKQQGVKFLAFLPFLHYIYIYKKKLIKLDFEYSRKWKAISSLQVFFQEK